MSGKPFDFPLVRVLTSYRITCRYAQQNFGRGRRSFHWGRYHRFLRLWMIEDLNNKVRLIQRRAYVYWDEGHLRLKVIAIHHPKTPNCTHAYPRSIVSGPL